MEKGKRSGRFFLPEFCVFTCIMSGFGGREVPRLLGFENRAGVYVALSGQAAGQKPQIQEGALGRRMSTEKLLPENLQVKELHRLR